MPRPSARPRTRSDVDSEMCAQIAGPAAAAASPASARETTSSARLVESAAAALETANSAVPASSARRRPNRSLSSPRNGAATAYART